MPAWSPIAPVLILFSVNIAIGVFFSIWAYRFSRRLRPEAYADPEARENLVRRVQVKGTIASFFPMAVYFAIPRSWQGGFSLFPMAMIQVVANAVILGHVTSSLERQIRGTQARLLAVLSRALRFLFGIFVAIGIYSLIVIGLPIVALDFLGELLNLSEVSRVILLLIGPLLGGFSVWVSAPILTRLMLPCSRIVDPQLIQILERTFRKVKLPVPTFWGLNRDLVKFHKTLFVGSSFGKGWFSRSLFISRSLFQNLEPCEFEAVILHEVSLHSLGHLRKRSLSVAILSFAAFFLSIAFISATEPFLPDGYAEAIGLSIVMAEIFIAQSIFMKVVVRRAIFDADENAIRLGAPLEAMIGALEKLSRLNVQTLTKKASSSWLIRAFAPPTPQKRVENLRSRALQNFPKRESLWIEITAPLGRFRKFLLPAFSLGILSVFAFGIYFLRPISDLQNAARTGDLATVEKLVSSGVNISAPDPFRDNHFPLFAASAGGHLEVVKYLIRQGAKVDQRLHRIKTTALMAAAAQGHLQVLETLLKSGANIDSEDHFRRTPLFYAVIKEKRDAARFLIERGAKVNAKDFHDSTPLGFASWQGSAPLVALLLKHGANINDKDRDGDTALGMALQFSDIKKTLLNG